MRLLRCIIVSGSAAVLAGTFMLAGQAPGPAGPGPTAAAPARAAGPASHRPSAGFLADARTALTRYLQHNQPQVSLVHRPRGAAPRGDMAPGGPEVGTSRLSS